jgi:hypothetical protein
VSKGFEYNDPASITPNAPPGCGGLPGGVCRSAFFNEFAPRSGNLTLLLGAGGAKFNVTGNLLLSGSVLFPLTTAGILSPVTPVIGLDYAF